METQMIGNLAQACDAALDLGHDAQIKEGALIVPVGGSEHPFVAALIISEDGKTLSVNCQIAKVGQLQKDEDGEISKAFLYAAVESGSRTSPYSITILSDQDDADMGGDENEWPVVLQNSIPLVGDFTSRELEAALDGLREALVTASDILSIGLGKTKIEETA